MSGDGHHTTPLERALRQIPEQLGHAAWGSLPALVWLGLAPISPVLAGGVAGLALALPREIVDQWPIGRPWDTALDLSFFGLGGAVAGWVWGLVAA
jgi:hypothetical protein